MQCSALVKIPYCGELGQRGSMPLTSTSSTGSGWVGFFKHFWGNDTQKDSQKMLETKTLLNVLEFRILFLWRAGTEEVNATEC